MLNLFLILKLFFRRWNKILHSRETKQKRRWWTKSTEKMFVKVATNTKHYARFAKEIPNVVSINSRTCKFTFDPYPTANLLYLVYHPRGNSCMHQIEENCYNSRDDEWVNIYHLGELITYMYFFHVATIFMA